MQTWQSVAKILKSGGVAVIPTDTIYGIVGSALLKKTVERIYNIKGRDDTKPCIILITDYKDLDIFGVAYNKKDLEKFWPGKVSVELPYLNSKIKNKFKYLNRGTSANSFRMIGPRNRNLFKLIQKVGPLVAPSANPQGLLPAESIAQARAYFNISVDGYVDGGIKRSKPSTLVGYKDGVLVVFRQGSVIVK